MNRTIGRFLILGVVGLALSLGGRSTAKAQWSWWDGGYYNYGVGYSPYAYGYGYSPYSTNYWPSQYYTSYGSYYSPWSTSYWPGSCCGGCSSCGGGCGSSCGSCCGISSGCSSGCCGIGGCSGGCGVASCGGFCGSGCTLACGPSCGCSSGCGTSSGCGASTPAPAGKPRPEPDGGFTPRPSPTYDDAAPKPTERSPRTPLTNPPAGGSPPAAGMDADPGTGRYSRDRAGDGLKPAPTQTKDNFDLPATKSGTTSPPAGGAPKDDVPFETKKPILQRGADKKAPISTPDDPASEDTSSKKKAKPDTNPDLKKPSAELEDKSNERTRQNAPALTLQDRSTWHLTGVSRPLFGRIANRPAPTPERLTSSNGDWAVFSADEAQVVRR
jgi:hypothetical protein